MFLLDDREDAVLTRYLTSHGVPTETTHLDSGDACFEGKGPRNLPVLIGLERKHLSDVVGSMTDRRLSGHQLRAMWSTYDYCYLVIEDNYRPAEDGSIEVYRGNPKPRPGRKPTSAKPPSAWVPLYFGGHGISYRQLSSFLCSLEIFGNLIVVRTSNPRETAALYAARYYWWQRPYDSHHSHDQIYSPGPEVAQTRGKAILVTRQPGLVEKMAAQLPGIYRRAWAVGRRFRSVEQMVNATEKEWMEIEGIGKIIAKQVVESLHR